MNFWRGGFDCKMCFCTYKNEICLKPLNGFRG